MKKKIAILLAAVMTATMVPVSAFANSSNNVNKTVTVKDGDVITDVYLSIQPAQGIEWGDSIVLTVENGEFETVSECKIDGNGWDYFVDRYNSAMSGDLEDTPETPDDPENPDNPENPDTPETPDEPEDVVFNANVFGNIMDASIYAERDALLPWQMIRNSKREVEIKLFPLPQSLAGETYETKSPTLKTNRPHYYIQLPITADGSGEISVSIDNNGTSITGSSGIRIGNSSTSSGSTTTTIDEIMVGSDDVELGVITIKESVHGTFVPGKQVTLRVNSGFELEPAADRTENNKKIEGFRITAGTNADFEALTKDSKGVEFDGNTLTFTMPELGNGEDGKSTKNPASIKISGLVAIAEDDDNFGDIKITVSGTSAGITKETIKVGERGDYGFTMKAIEDPATIYAGRIGEVDHNFDALDKAGDDFSKYMNSEAFKQYDADDNLSATIEFAEITADSWNQSRKLEFTVPEGVKIADWDIDEEEDCKNLDAAATITNDGRTLTLNLKKGGEVDEKEASSFEMQLTLSADATFEGDVTLSVEGAGISEGDIEDVVIAKVVSPVTIEAQTTKSNMGYQKIATSDITITEAEDGILVKGGDVNIEIDSIYGNQELGFADENIDYEIDGDLKIKNFKVSDGVISFKVDSSSSKASKITIKNVMMGTTRAVPFGSYDLKVGGSAIISNFSEDLVDNSGDETTADGTKKAGVGFFDDNDALKFANYINVITDPGTLDKVVKVTIGEKTILVDDQSYDMDVAPYIQTESNSTMVPLRFVMVALGVDSDNVGSVDESSKVSFDSNTKTATIFYASGTNMTTIQFQAGSNIMKVNGANIPMENGVKAEIVDGRMFVPFRAIGTAINVNVGWDADTRTATYNA